MKMFDVKNEVGPVFEPFPVMVMNPMIMKRLETMIEVNDYNEHPEIKESIKKNIEEYKLFKNSMKKAEEKDTESAEMNTEQKSMDEIIDLMSGEDVIAMCVSCGIKVPVDENNEISADDCRLVLKEWFEEKAKVIKKELVPVNGEDVNKSDEGIVRFE